MEQTSLAYINIVEKLMSYVDSRNWAGLANEIFAKEVKFDYSSFSGQPATFLSGQQIVDTWQGLVPGFDLTQHKTSNYKVSQSDEATQISADVRAIHIIDGAAGGDYWIVDGTYDFEIKDAKVTLMRLNFAGAIGNGDMLKIASSRAASK